MKRLKLILQFEGSAFCGWQMQSQVQESTKSSVQYELENALATIFKSKQRIVVQGASRTDAGVHAQEFLAHALVEDEIHFDKNCKELRRSLNGILPKSIAVMDCAWAKDFHALKNTKSKTYRYQLWMSAGRRALHHEKYFFVPYDPADSKLSKSFSFELLKACCDLVQGEHDFKCFVSSGSSAVNTVRVVDSVTLVRKAVSKHYYGEEVFLYFKGGGFLKQMVRNLLGTMLDVAKGKILIEDFKKLLFPVESEYKRIQAGFCAPAAALFLEKVEFS